MRGILLGLILISAASCAVGSGPSFCDVYSPIPTDEATPEHVQLVIDDNNIAWTLCP
jgi:hypothetical protein